MRRDVGVLALLSSVEALPAQMEEAATIFRRRCQQVMCLASPAANSAVLTTSSSPNTSWTAPYYDYDKSPVFWWDLAEQAFLSSLPDELASQILLGSTQGLSVVRTGRQRYAIYSKRRAVADITDVLKMEYGKDLVATGALKYTMVQRAQWLSLRLNVPYVRMKTKKEKAWRRRVRGAR